MTPRRWSVLAAGAAAVTAVVLALAPTVSTSSCTTSSTGAMTCASGGSSLLATEGAGVLVVLAVPVIVAAVPLIVPWRRSATAAAGALTLAMLAGMASIGFLLLPTVALAWVAASRT